MITPSANYNNFIYAPQRDIDVKVKVGSTDISQYVKNVSIIESVGVDSFAFGNTCSSQLEMEVYNPAVQLQDQWISVEAGIRVNGAFEYIKMGKFKVYEVTTDNLYKTSKVLAYDALAYMIHSYVPHTSTQTLSAVVQDIANTEGVEMEPQTLPSTPVTWYSEEWSSRDMLGYMAGLFGTNCRMSRNGKLVFTPFAQCSAVITDDEILLGEMQNDTETSVNVGGLEVTTDEEVIGAGAGRVGMYYNPYMTQEILTAIVQANLPITYEACKFKYRGNPCIEPGDIITVNGKKVIVMSQKWELGEGFNCEITSYPLTDESLVRYAEPVSKKDLKSVENRLGHAMQEATNNILGINGGFFELLVDEASGKPYGFRIMDTAEVTPTTKGWQGDYNGLGYSTDGFQTISKVALDMANGSVIADNIIADAILSNTFHVERTVTKYATDYSNADAERLQQILSGNVEPTAEDFDKLDLNGDGDITTADLLFVRRLVDGTDASKTVNYSVTIAPKDKKLSIDSDGFTVTPNRVFAKNLQVANTLMVDGEYISRDALMPRFVQNSETIVGYWINGKPIYRQVWYKGNIAAGSSSMSVTLDNPETIISVAGIADEGSAMSNAHFQLPYVNPSDARYEVGLFYRNGAINFRAGSAGAAKNAYVWIDYTKTTD